MSKAILTACFSVTFCLSEAQSGLNIQPGTVFFVAANQTVAVDGLALTPAASLSLPAPNDFTLKTTLTHPSASSSIARTYTVTNAVPGFTGSIAIGYQDAELNGIAENALTLNVHNGSSWADYPSGVARDATNNIVTTSGLSNITLSEITLAGQIAPLPLRWGGVQAACHATGVVLQWTVYDALNVSRFEIERNSGGAGWQKLGSLPFDVAAQAGQTYQFTDQTVANTQTFYRIGEVDLNGHTLYSKVVMISPPSATNAFVLFPNPASDQLKIAASGNGIRAWKLLGMDGQLIQSQRPGRAELAEISIDHLTPGIYQILVELVDGSQEKRLFMKR
jgi:hypothetical protein